MNINNKNYNNGNNGSNGNSDRIINNNLNVNIQK